MNNKIFLLCGLTFTGKSRLALTAPKPLVVLDTEQTIGHLIARHPDKKNIHVRTVLAWTELEEKLKALNQSPPATILLDSGSPLNTWSFLDAAREKGRDTDIWFHAAKRIENLIGLIKVIGCQHFIITSRVREKYENDQPTGDLAVDINSKILYAADVQVMMRGKSEEGYVSYIIKDRAHGVHNKRLVNGAFNDLM